MGAGLLVVKSGFILFNRIYQFFNNKHAQEREREVKREGTSMLRIRCVCVALRICDKKKLKRRMPALALRMFVLEMKYQ